MQLYTNILEYKSCKYINLHLFSTSSLTTHLTTNELRTLQVHFSLFKSLQSYTNNPHGIIIFGWRTSKTHLSINQLVCQTEAVLQYYFVKPIIYLSFLDRTINHMLKVVPAHRASFCFWPQKHPVEHCLNLLQLIPSLHGKGSHPYMLT